MTAFSEKISVSVRFFGLDILMNMQPTNTASTIVPSKHCMTSSTIASGHSSVIDLRPYPRTYFKSNSQIFNDLI